MLHAQANWVELPVGELVSTGQSVHAPADVAPAVVKYVPIPQSVHASDPVVVLYFPTTQAVHVPPSTPV
jgi:hypothetical protein